MGRPKIKSATDQRPFIMVYQDFIETKVLDAHEKMVFIALKRFADSKNQCYPSLQKLSEITGLSKRTVQEVIKTLEDKKVLTVMNRKRADGGKTSNLYTLFDFREMWSAESSEQMAAIVDEYETERLIDLLTAKGYRIEKELEVEPTKAQQQALKNNQYDINNTTPTARKSQELERYTLEQVKQFFEYDVMVTDHEIRCDEIDSVMSILYTNLNTTKETIRVDGEDKPTMVVIAKLMKLNTFSIMYAIEKFCEQTERIKNPTAYMLTLLYHAEEQMRLDISNKVAHNQSK